MDTDPDSPDYPIITDIVEAGTQIRHIVQNLLDFSTQESYEWFETDVQETIDDALTLVAHSLRKSKIEVVKQIANMPAIIVSASHLKLLWMNLFLNARDAISASDIEGRIEILARQANSEYVQIQITDNGIGIPRQHRNRLFHPFFTTKSTGKNLGLGLYTCQAIVESHNGQIEIDNRQEGPGTTVTVALPIQVDLHVAPTPTD
jgi:two-component system NtrC family sensor kinase